MPQPRITTQADLRRAFWESHSQMECRRNQRGNPKPQNSQPADTRMAFVDYVDAMQRDGEISEQLAQRATL